MSPAKILALAGSARTASLNKKLLRAAVAGAEDAGAEVTTVDLRDYPLPVFDEDWEAEHGFPEHARSLKSLIADHQGLLLASPEYNGTIPSILKNVLDWTSRKTAPGETLLAHYHGKVAALLCASPGPLGGMQGLLHLRDALNYMQVLVLPQMFRLPNAYAAFDEAGRLLDDKQRHRAEAHGRALADYLRRWHRGAGDA